ncbi:MAG: tetratricopeptide repeat protein [Spirochaetota bacterium]|nr:tetratricopeptide repeat protein [Spirochaetota bacterium]
MNIEILVFIIVGVAAVGALIFYLIKSASSSNRIEAVSKYIKLKEYDNAINILKGIISKDDDNVIAHYYLGECYFQTQNYEWALPEFKRVIKKNKYDKDFNEASVRRRLADIFLHYNQLEEAQKEFLLVTQLEPNNHYSFYEIGRIFLEREHMDKAAQYIKKSLEIDPNFADSLLYSGIIKYKTKLFSEALLDLEKCLLISKSNYKANYYIGMVNYNIKNHKKALEQFDFAIRDKEYRNRSLLQRGIIYNELGELDNSLAELQKAASYITEEDNIARTIRYYLANGYELKKDISSAIEQWEKIIASQPGFRDVEEKLNNYSDLRMEDRLKDFFVATNEAFENYCRKVLNKMGIEIKEVISVGSVVAEFLAQERLGTKDIRVQKVMVRVYRHNEPIGDKIVRDLAEKLKLESGMHHAICISATGFSKQATDFAETRPINLVGGKELSDLLKQIDL